MTRDEQIAHEMRNAGGMTTYELVDWDTPPCSSGPAPKRTPGGYRIPAHPQQDECETVPVYLGTSCPVAYDYEGDGYGVRMHARGLSPDGCSTHRMPYHGLGEIVATFNARAHERWAVVSNS